MAYIGKTPVIGNFVKLDAISVVNGQASYTMQNGGSNFTEYETVNQFLVSLNGVLQSPTDSFTVSGSTITFASNLVTGDVIDFVMVLGNTLDVGTVSDNTVSLAKLTATGTKDATTFLRGDNTFAEAGGGKVLQVVSYTKNASASFSSGASGVLHTGVSITPSSTSSKVLVLASNYGEANGTTSHYAETLLYRNGTTNLGYVNDATAYQKATSERWQYGYSYLDSPSSTSSTSYSFYHNNISGTSRVYTYYRTYYTLLEIGA